MTDTKVWFMTDAGRGTGVDIATAALAAGNAVVAIGRNPEAVARAVGEAVGADVRTVHVGNVVLMPFAYADGTCVFCHEGLHTSCIHGGFFGSVAVAGAQADAVRIPLADGTLCVLPGGHDEALLPSLLTLTDVMGTGHHVSVAACVGPG